MLIIYGKFEDGYWVRNFKCDKKRFKKSWDYLSKKMLSCEVWDYDSKGKLLNDWIWKKNIGWKNVNDL